MDTDDLVHLEPVIGQDLAELALANCAKVLDLQRNIFDKVRVPVVDYHDETNNEIINEICSKELIDDKMHRPEHREHGSEGYES